MKHEQQKHVSKTVKLGSLLAATFANISTENDKNMWCTSNSTGIFSIHTNVTQ